MILPFTFMSIFAWKMIGTKINFSEDKNSQLPRSFKGWYRRYGFKNHQSEMMISSFRLHWISRISSVLQRSLLLTWHLKWHSPLLIAALIFRAITFRAAVLFHLIFYLRWKFYSTIALLFLWYLNCWKKCIIGTKTSHLWSFLKFQYKWQIGQK